MSDPKNATSLTLSDEQIVRGVLDWFKIFASVPHGSKNEKALTDLLAEKFSTMGFTVERDEWYNMKVDVPAAPGYEHLPAVILQGHLDMVCAVTEGSGYVPERDPINIVIRDNVMYSDGRSSLGADNGLGNSCGFVLLDQPLKRGPIRLILTTDEEAGMTGAKMLDPAWLSGCSELINLDSGSVGVSIVSCSGGLYQIFRRKATTVPNCRDTAFELALSGFRGGHSGAEIHLGRGNAIKLLAWFLDQLRPKMDFELADLQGGHVTNAIPLESKAVLTLDRADAEALQRELDSFRADLAEFYKNIDPGIQVELTEVAPPAQVWSREDRDNTLDFVELLHNGVYARYDTMPERVFASCNVGIAAFRAPDEIEIAASIRSATPFPEQQLADRHQCAARLAGFETENGGHYPGWPGDESNPLAQLVDRVYRQQTGNPTKILTIHAGLEPAIFGKKAPELRMVSIGPDTRRPHSTGENAPLERIPTFVRLLAGVLEALAE